MIKRYIIRVNIEGGCADDMMQDEFECRGQQRDKNVRENIAFYRRQHSCADAKLAVEVYERIQKEVV